MIGAAAMSSALVLPGISWALTLDEARSQGLVGEGMDGYLFIVQNNGEVQAFVQSVNAQRRAQYQDIAARTNAPMAAVEQQAGAQLIARAQPGWYVMTPNGAARR